MRKLRASVCRPGYLKSIRKDKNRFQIKSHRQSKSSVTYFIKLLDFKGFAASDNFVLLLILNIHRTYCCFKFMDSIFISYDQLFINSTILSFEVNTSSTHCAATHY